MSERKIREIVKLIRFFLKKRGVLIDKIVLFGSYARGKMTKNSDVDIAVVSKNFAGKDIFERSQMLNGLNWVLVQKFMLPFDIVPIASDEWETSSSLIVGFVRKGKELKNC